MIHLVGNTQNDIPVYVDLIGSKAAQHIAQQPYLLTLAAEALRSTVLDGPSANVEHDMGRVIGYDFVVKTTDADVIFYAQLMRDNAYTRFVKNGKPLATKHLTLVLQRDQKGALYNMHDVWIGHFSPPRPGSAQETTKGKAYWEEHAFVFENQPIQARTLTKTCPY